VQDPNQHVLRFGHGIAMQEPKLEVERVQLDARIEKRLAHLVGDLAKHSKMTVGELLEDVLLHSFEKTSAGGVACPYTERTLALIEELKLRHLIDYDTHVSYRFAEKPPAR
jgi:hypothetical protein